MKPNDAPHAEITRISRGDRSGYGAMRLPLGTGQRTRDADRRAFARAWRRCDVALEAVDEAAGSRDAQGRSSVSEPPSPAVIRRKRMNRAKPQPENVTQLAWDFTARTPTSLPQPSGSAPLMRRFAPLLLLTLSCASASAQSLSEQILELTNVERWNNGQLPPVKGQAQLNAAATLHSTNMATRNFFAHNDPLTGTNPGARIGAAGYSYSTWSENIAAGNSTAAATMGQWMNSSGHRTNILSGSVNELGVGYAHGPASTYRHYWTQNFGRRSGVYPVVIAREAFRTTACSVPLYVYGSGFATQMRFSNDGVNWSSWQTYAANATWGLTGASGTTATVRSQIRNSGGTVIAAEDSIVLGTACGTVTPPDPNRIFVQGFEG
jgi:uncharacterized protein YkwD